jgi:hypothetical protein
MRTLINLDINMKTNVKTNVQMGSMAVCGRLAPPLHLRLRVLSLSPLHRTK